MTTPTMTNWVVTYNDHTASGGVLAAHADVFAAYYAPDGHLVEFKDSNHQVVFALHAGIVLTIRRANAVAQDGATA